MCANETEMQTELNNNIGHQRRIMRERGICVVIPTYNNASTICDVVSRTRLQCDDVIVVCDGSTDGTAELLRSMEGITLVENARNGGKGEALKLGFRKAISMGFAYAVTLDADGQHFPEDIPVLLSANIKHPGKLIVGQRRGLDKADRSFGSKFANSFSNFWFSVQTGVMLKDTQTGYRLYPLRKLHGLSLLTSRYEAELELLVFSSWHGVDIISEEVSVYYPPREERVSHFRPVADFTRISVLNTILCVLAIVYALPLKILRVLLVFLRTTYSLIAYLVLCFVLLLPITLVLRATRVRREKTSAILHRLLNSVAKLIVLRHGIPGVRYTVENDGEDFNRPAVIICNHQSHLDLMVMLSQTSKLVILTNDWVWNSPFFGMVIRNAEYYPVSMGIDAILPKLQSLVKRGYSIVVYPEGTRSKDCSIGRFYKGAFHIARTLRLDILPMIEYGMGNVLPKKGKYLRKGHMLLSIRKRVSFDDYDRIGTTKEITSWFRRYYINEYSRMCNRMDQWR